MYNNGKPSKIDLQILVKYNCSNSEMCALFKSLELTKKKLSNY